MSGIDSVIQLSPLFKWQGQPDFKLDLAHFVCVQRVADGYGRSTSHVSFVNPDGETEVRIVTDDAEWIRAQHADYMAAKNHEGAGRSTVTAPQPFPLSAFE